MSNEDTNTNQETTDSSTPANLTTQVVNLNGDLVIEMAADLHWALRDVPLDIGYHEKLDLYAKNMVHDYNWVKMPKYNSHTILDLLPLSSRILTADNNIATKHDTGWVVFSPEAYVFSRVATENIALPVFGLPAVDN